MSLTEMKSSSESGNQSSSAAGSPVSRTVLQENVKRLVMSVILRENSKGSFARLNPDGSLLKMSRGYAQANLDGFLESSCMIFPKWGIVSDGVAGELSILEPATGGNGYLLLPTVLANNLECRGKEYCGTRHAMKLHQAINLIPTCQSRESGNYMYANGDHGKPVATLTGKIALLPTCTSRDHKDTGKMENVPVNALLGRELGKNHGMKLQPAFAEWMMGFPQDWTDTVIASHRGDTARKDSSASEMPSSRSKFTRSSKRSQTSKKEHE